MITKEQEIRGKIILTIAMALIMISIGLKTVDAYEDNNYVIEYEYVNIKDIAPTKVSNKKENNDISLTRLLMNNLNVSRDYNLFENNNIEETTLINKNKVEEVTLLKINNVEEKPKVVWKLPTEMGTISQYPYYGHPAYDITSPRGSNELIFPVANGVITGKYIDPAGALVVTILHNIDGKRYTSQYAHLSSFANDIYVGKEVTINDCIGRMGTTGYSTGVHLHLALVDCALFDPNDPYCKDLNGFFNYAKTRIAQGYYGLGVHLYMPYSWSSR